MTSPKTPKPDLGTLVPSWTTSNALTALTDAISASTASPILIASWRGTVSTLRNCMAAVGLNSTPAPSANGCTAEDALMVVANAARSLAKPTPQMQHARELLGASFNTVVVVVNTLKGFRK